MKAIIRIPSSYTRELINVNMQNKWENTELKRKSCTTSRRRCVKCSKALEMNRYQPLAPTNVIKWPKVVEIQKSFLYGCQNAKMIQQ
jgi:hypothetical protein